MGRALANRAAVHGVLLRARTTSSSMNARRVKLPSSVPAAPPGTTPTPNRGKARHSFYVLTRWPWLLLRRRREGGAGELAVLAEHRMPHLLRVRDAAGGGGAEVVAGAELVERLGVLVVGEGEGLGGLKGRLRGHLGLQPRADGRLGGLRSE